MQVQSVEKSVLNVGFKSSKGVEKASAFVNMNDEQTRNLAYLMSQKGEKKKRNFSGTFLLTLPIVDILSKGILEEGNLGKKTFAAGKTATGWSRALVVLGVYSAVKKVVVSRSERLQNFEKQNPLEALIADFALFGGSLFLANKGASKIEAKVMEKNPQISEKMTSSLLKLSDKINDSKLNKEILPRIQDYAKTLAEKAPTVSKVGKFALVNSVLITFFAGLALASSKSTKKMEAKKQEIEKNYQLLKKTQLKTAREINKVLRAENEVLVQSQNQIAKDLRKVLQEEKPISERAVYVIRENVRMIDEENF